MSIWINIHAKLYILYLRCDSCHIDMSFPSYKYIPAIEERLRRTRLPAAISALALGCSRHQSFSHSACVFKGGMMHWFVTQPAPESSLACPGTEIPSFPSLVPLQQLCQQQLSHSFFSILLFFIFIFGHSAKSNRFYKDSYNCCWHPSLRPPLIYNK